MVGPRLQRLPQRLQDSKSFFPSKGCVEHPIRFHCNEASLLVRHDAIHTIHYHHHLDHGDQPTRGTLLTELAFGLCPLVAWAKGGDAAKKGCWRDAGTTCPPMRPSCSRHCRQWSSSTDPPSPCSPGKASPLDKQREKEGQLPLTTTGLSSGMCDPRGASKAIFKQYLSISISIPISISSTLSRNYKAVHWA